MEFERNAPTTAQDVALADAPRLSLNPLHGDVRADLSSAPRLGSASATQPFEFETESTAAAAKSHTSGSTSHHRTAALLGAATALLFISGLIVLYLVR